MAGGEMFLLYQDEDVRLTLVFANQIFGDSREWCSFRSRESVLGHGKNCIPIDNHCQFLRSSAFVPVAPEQLENEIAFRGQQKSEKEKDPQVSRTPQTKL